MAELARAGGIGFGIVIFPFENQIDGSCSDSPQGDMYRFCSEKGIPCLDLLEVYRRNGEKVYIDGDYVHPNPKGHQLAGEAVSRWLKADGAFRDFFHGD
jgi:lysophospholipase L1-like esterase